MIRLLGWLAAYAVIGIAISPWAAEPEAEALTIRWVPDSSAPHRASACVFGLSPEILRWFQAGGSSSNKYSRLFLVYAGLNLSAAKDLPPMSGVYMIETNILRFEPRFPLEPGVSYTAILNLEALSDEQARPRDEVRATIQLPVQRENPTTIVSRVCPTGERLPENLLKFYIHFSAPMSRGNIYEHIHLRRQSGQDVELPFLEIDEELWDPSMMRLTLLLDPGRIKRGVRPLEEAGPALEAGKVYTLIIDKGWKDGTGNPLKAPFQKRFRVGPPDRDPPKPANWRVESPRSSTRESLRIDFRKSMDEALAQRTIQVTTPAGLLVRGEVTLKEHERKWFFIPEKPWTPGSYKIVVGTTIEDLAGNNIGKPFDVDLFERVDDGPAKPTIELPIEIR